MRLLANQPDRDGEPNGESDQHGGGQGGLQPTCRSALDGDHPGGWRPRNLASGFLVEACQARDQFILVVRHDSSTACEASPPISRCSRSRALAYLTATSVG